MRHFELFADFAIVINSFIYGSWPTDLRARHTTEKAEEMTAHVGQLGLPRGVTT